MQNLHDFVIRPPDAAALFPTPHPVAIARSAHSPLTDAAIRKAKPREKSYRMHDTGGLYLEVFPNGSKLWRWKYRYEGKENRLAFGKYPAVGLKDARETRDDARKLLRTGVNPSGKKQLLEAANQNQAAGSFEAVARDWYERMMRDKADSHRLKIRARLEKDIFPWLGNRPIGEITARDLLCCLRRIEDRGAHDTAHRALQTCSAVFRHAVVEGKAKENPAIHLKGALTPARRGHFAAITEPGDVGPLLLKMDAVSATFAVKCALKLAPYLFCRPGELRMMRWREVHLDAAQWRYVAFKTKTPHI